MLRITYLILLFNVSISFSSFSQERKIEKRVYSNFREGKLDLALTELDNLKDKYGDKSFFHYWKAFIYMEKISQLKRYDYEIINRDNAVFFIDISLRTLKEASQYLTAEELSISKEDFEILFPGCIVIPPNGETKYTHSIISLKSEFYIKEEYLRELQYNLSLGKLIEEYKLGNRFISPFLNEIKPRVKSNPAKNPLYGEVSKSTYMELANIRNQRELVQLQKELTDKNWINYIKTYKEEEYLSIVPELETLINKFYFNNLENQYQKIKNNVFELKTYLSNLEANKNLMETNALKYINSKYGEIKLSNTFMDLRKVNYHKIINEGTIKLKELIEIQEKIEREEKLERQNKFENLGFDVQNFDENFDDNSNGWFEIENENELNKLVDGKFIIENKYDKARFFTATKIDLFGEHGGIIIINRISIDTKWINGNQDNSYEIVWGANVEGDFLSFGINAAGSYRFTNRRSGTNNIVINWMESEHINKKGSNVLSVRENEGKLEFYINYFKVNECDLIESFGQQIGFLVNGAQRVEFDDLKVAFTETGLGGPIIDDGYGPGVKDINGNTYKTVYIGLQEWMAENLKVNKYNDGTVIPNITDNTKWGGNNIGAWAYYNNDASKNAKYGKLYNWYAVSGRKNVCPTGWHVPSDDEWTILTDYLGGETVAGGKMKEVGTTNWNSPNAGATNMSLFTGLPGGYRSRDGNYNYIGNSGGWWSSTEYITYYAWGRNLSNSSGNAHRNDSGKEGGLSVRCLRD
jgi:uncharacterized protein (TIGR02145 family)